MIAWIAASTLAFISQVAVLVGLRVAYLDRKARRGH